MMQPLSAIERLDQGRVLARCTFVKGGGIILQGW